jgi:flagellar hook protein FlgE
MAFEIGLSGLEAASENLSVLGQNIANVNTYGYKSSSTDFSNTLSKQLNSANSGSGLQTGGGAMTSNIQQSFAQGTISGTNSSLDAAITGPGFFITYDPNLLQASYTRNGHFSVNNSGILVNGNGQEVMGYTADATGNISPTGAPTSIDLTTYNINPLTTGANRVYEQDTVTFYQLSNEGKVTVGGLTFTNNSGKTMTAAELASAFSGLAAGSDGSIFADGQSNPLASSFSGTLGNYDLSTSTTDSGTLIATASVYGGTTIQTLLNSPLNDLSPSVAVSVSGVDTAYMTKYAIGNDGTITGTYSDGSTFKLAQFALASFSNSNGLRSEGNNSWVQTAASGSP